MVTDYSHFAAGNINYLNASEDETIEFGTPKVDIENYPSNYAEQWILIVPEGRKVQIDFDIFELEDSENCKNDYVEFREASILVILKEYMAILVQSWQDACVEMQSQTRYWVKGIWLGFSSWVIETLPLCTRDSKLLLKQVCYNNQAC